MPLERPNPEAHGEILQLTAMRSTKYGSLERYFVALAEAARARSWRLVLQYRGIPRSARYLKDLDAMGAIVVTSRAGEGRVREAWRALALIARRRPRVVHLHFSGTLALLAVGLLARRLGVLRIVATVHSLPNPRFRALAKSSYARIDLILCISSAVREAMVELGVSPSVLTTRYLGVPDLGSPPADAREQVRRSLSIPATADVLVAITFEHPVKGTDVLVDAFLDHLLPRFSELHLVIVGIQPSDAGSVSPRADMAPDRLHWAGIQDDVRPFLTAADVYIQPSRKEGLGLAILEAMREGLPIVASNVGGIPEAVADGTTGLLVPPDAPEQLATAISRLIIDRDLARSLGAAGHAAWKVRFSVARSVAETLDDYERPPSRERPPR